MGYSLAKFICISSSLSSEDPSPPYIIRQPPTVEIIFEVDSNGDTNKPFYLECEAIGYPTPEYYWTKNGKRFMWQTYDDRISQQTGRGTLSISTPLDEDEGQYQCFAKNQYGIAASNSVFAPKSELDSVNISQPISLRGNEGEPFKLTCQPPDVWPKPIVHWVFFYSNGDLKTINDSRITLDPEGNLWFSNLTRSDGMEDAMYSCQMTPPTKFEYKILNRVLLTVLPTGIPAGHNKNSPVLQYVTTKNEVAYRRKHAQLFCIFGGTPLPKVVWSKNGKIIQSSDRITEGNHGKSLIIRVHMIIRYKI